MQKLNLHSMVELVLFAVRNGIIRVAMSGPDSTAAAQRARASLPDAIRCSTPSCLWVARLFTAVSICGLTSNLKQALLIQRAPAIRRRHMRLQKFGHAPIGVNLIFDFGEAVPLVLRRPCIPPRRRAF